MTTILRRGLCGTIATFGPLWHRFDMADFDDEEYLDEIRPKRPCKNDTCSMKTRNLTGYCRRSCHRDAMRMRPASQLRDGSAPQPYSEISVDEVDHERRIWCRRYSRCLSVAVARSWAGWTCSQCEIDDELEPHERRMLSPQQIEDLKYVIYR